MKRAAPAKVSDTSQTPVFPQTLHRVRQRGKPVMPGAKPQKRDNVFSKSRDTREDRGERQMKTSHNPQTIPHGK
jgi:hypothetical protein